MEELVRNMPKLLASVLINIVSVFWVAENQRGVSAHKMAPTVLGHGSTLDLKKA